MLVSLERCAVVEYRCSSFRIGLTVYAIVSIAVG